MGTSMDRPEINTVPRPCACTTVRAAGRSLARAFDAAMRHATLSVTQLAVMRALERQPDAPLTRVAEALSMDRTSLYRAVGTMEREGWLVVKEGANARSRSCGLTARGHAALGASGPAWEEAQRSIIDRFGRRRWRSLVQELQALAAIATEVERMEKADGTEAE